MNSRPVFTKGMKLATVHKLSELSTQTVIDVLNNTRTIREAAGQLNVSTKAVYDYMHTRNIVRHCVYFSTKQRDFVAKIVMPPMSDQEGQAQ